MGFNKRIISYEMIQKRLDSQQSFIPLSEWKKGRPAPTEKQMSDVSKKEITKSKKQQSREKLKEKQRSL